MTVKTLQKIQGVVVGQISAVSGQSVSVTWPTQTKPVAATSTVSIAKENTGQNVALMFEGGNPEKPIIMGLIVDPSEGADEPMEVPVLTASGAARSAVEVDGEAVDYAYLEGKEMVVLRCGRASITMTKEGKVIIRGAYISSRSSGVNRMKGGSIQLN